MTKVLDTVPGLPKDRMMRMLCTWLSDMDYARTGKVFITTWGYGRYSFHLETGKLERLADLLCRYHFRSYSRYFLNPEVKEI